MGNPAQKKPEGTRIFCHAYPLACSGVSAVRAAGYRKPGGHAPAHRGFHARPIPPCTPVYCYLFEEIHLDREGREA